MDVLENYEMLYASKNEGKQSCGYILHKYFFFSLFFIRKMSENYLLFFRTRNWWYFNEIYLVLFAYWTHQERLMLKCFSLHTIYQGKMVSSLTTGTKFKLWLIIIKTNKEYIYTAVFEKTCTHRS